MNFQAGIWTQVLWTSEPNLFPLGSYSISGALMARDIFSLDLRKTLKFCKP